MADETISVGLTADNKTFVQSFNEGASAVKNLTSAGQTMASAFRRAGAEVQASVHAIEGVIKKVAITTATAMGGIAYATHKGLDNFRSFETAMANVQTVMDTTGVSAKSMGDAVMAMTGQFPQSAEELATGLYEVNSAGFQGAKGLAVLKATAMLSTAGLIDMTTAVRGTASILNAYNLSASDAGHVTDVIFKAVEVGQMTADEFTQNIGDWAAAASSLGVPFESASAALATMTTRGALPAAQASTSLSAIFRALIKPSDEMGKAITRAGFSSGKAMLQNLGLAKTLGTLWEASGKNETSFSNLFQDTEALRGGLGLVTTGYDMLTKTQEQFNSASETTGTVAAAFAVQMDTLANKGKLFGNEIRQQGYEMGKMVAPIASAFLGLGTTVLHTFNSMPEPIRGVVATLQLLAPAVAIVGGLLLVNAARARIWTRAMSEIAKVLNLSGATEALSVWVGKVGAAGGPIKFMRNEVVRFAAADSAMRASMMATVGTAALYAAAFAVAVIAVSSLVGAISNAKSKAAAVKGTFLQVDSGQIKNVHDLATEYERAVAANQDFYKKSGGNSIVNDLLASLQMITPFTQNTKLNAAVASDSMADLAVQYQTLYTATQFLGDATGKTGDQVLTALNQMASEGSVNIETLITEYAKWMKILQDPGVAKFQSAQYLSDVMAKAAGMTPVKLNPTDFMSPETAAEFTRLNGIFANTEDEIKKVADAQKELKVANESTSASAQAFALAMIAMGDSASTASEKFDAFSTIIDQLLGNTVNMRDNQSAWIQSMEKAGQAMVDNGASFDMATEKGQNLQEAISAASKATTSLAEETVKQSGNQSDAIPIVKGYVDGMVAVAQQAGFGESAIAQMISVMGLTPDVIQTLITLPGMDPEMAKLLSMSGVLSGLNGYVAQAGVNVTISVTATEVPMAPGYVDPNAKYKLPKGGAPTSSAAQSAQDAIDKMIAGIKANVPKTKAKGGGGGGGGGAAKDDKWAPSAEQLANMQAALAAPIVDMLTGELGAAWQKQLIDNWMTGVTGNMLAEGKTKLGAGILQAAATAGTDPTDELRKAAEEYNRLVKMIGKANADAVLGMTDNLDEFGKYVDAVEALTKHQQDVEDWKSQRGEIDLADYKKLLEARLVNLEAYSDDWMSVQDQIKSVDDQMSQKQKDDLDEEKRLQQARLTLNEISKADYLTYLRARLVNLDKYSQEYMDIWQEIQDMEKQVVDDQKAATDAVKSFADDVKQAFDDIAKSVSDPMIRATSLIAAFGDQATVTQDQIQGFYSHMLEGTQRWVTVIKALKAAGVNQSFLTELIQAGPQSLSFAEQVLAMGPGGISMINQNMADIADLATGLGTNIASGSVGTLNQTDQSIHITVGNIAITGEMPGGVTIDQVAAAISSALSGIAVSVGSGQPNTISVGPTGTFIPTP